MPYLVGRHDPETLAELARGRLRAKLPDLRLALDGRVQPHHRVLLTRILAHIDLSSGVLGPAPGRNGTVPAPF